MIVTMKDVFMTEAMYGNIGYLNITPNGFYLSGDRNSPKYYGTRVTPDQYVNALDYLLDFQAEPVRLSYIKYSSTEWAFRLKIRSEARDMWRLDAVVDFHHTCDGRHGWDRIDTLAYYEVDQLREAIKFRLL